MGMFSLAGLGGQIMNSAFGALNQSISNHYQKDLLKYVNENKHQWEVNDLRAAGLNPILSANATGFANASGGGIGSNDLGMSSASANNKMAERLNDATLKNQKDIADQQNKTQKEFNEEANRINLINALSRKEEVTSNAAFNLERVLTEREQRKAIIAGIIRADRVADSEVARNLAIGYGSKVNADANMKNANTGYEHFVSKKRLDDLDVEFKQWENKWKSEHPYSSQYGGAFQAIDFMTDKTLKSMKAIR